MDFVSSLKMAGQSLTSNKLRSFLTMLGVIIGVGAVIIMVALGQGTSSGITSRLSSMGANLLTVSSAMSAGPIRGAGGSTLTMGDVDAIGELPLVKYVAPEASTSSATITVGSTTWSTTVDGTVPELQTIKNWPTVQGSFFEDSDVECIKRVAVLGQTVVTNLFPSANPLGQTIRINGLSFTVVGVMKEKGDSSGSDQDDVIYVPITTAQQRLLGSQTVRTINVQAESAEALTSLKDFINTLLRQRHRITNADDDDFQVRDMAEILSTIEDTTKMLSFLLGGIAAVSLLVGGIGIMNIMLVSVTERTREIGIRMAIGATTRAILTQFLIEALLLCFIGGLIGVAVGCGGAKILSVWADLSMQISPWLITTSMGFAIMIGLFFGYYPARQAANSDPIEALRFE